MHVFVPREHHYSKERLPESQQIGFYLCFFSLVNQKKENKSFKQESDFEILQLITYDKYSIAIPYLNSGHPKLPFKEAAQKVNLENAGTNKCC